MENKMMKTDSKGRIIIPKKMREDFENQNLICIKIKKIARIMTDEVWEEIFDFKKYSKLNCSLGYKRNLMRIICASSRQIDMDKQGRVNLSGILEPNKEYVFVRKKKVIHIMEKEYFETQNKREV